MIANYRKTNDYKKWALFIISVEILYIITELAFNSAILNATGGLVWSRDSISTLEFCGRVLSGFGFGFGLMVLKLKKFKTTKFKVRFNFFFVALLICVPLMYFSQKIIIDEAFIKRASNETLEKADQSMMIKSSFQLNSFKIGKIEFDKEKLTDPNAMSLTAMLGLLVMDDAYSHEVLKKYSFNIFVNNGRYFNSVSSEQAWEAYKAANVKIADAWKEYSKATKEFETKRNNELKTALIKSRWKEVLKISDQAFTDFKKARGKYISAVKEKAISQGAYRRMNKGFTKLNKCRSSSCINRTSQSLRKGIKKYTGFDKPLSFWCKSGSRCTIDRNYLYRQLAMAQAETGDFKRQTGLSFHTNKLSQFMANPTYIKKLSETIENKYGVNNFKDFNGTQSSFNSAYRKAVVFTMAKTWYESSGDAFGLSPSLSSSEFYYSEVVQNNLKAIFGLDESFKYVVKNNMSKEKFLKELKVNVLTVKGNSQSANLLNGLSEKSDDSQISRIDKKEAYRDSLRGIVVPPIALFFSLFFSAFILVRFPLHMISIYFYEKSNKWRLTARTLIITLGVSVIFILPLIVSHSNEENQLRIDSTITHFDKVGVNMTLWEWPLRWFFAAEPIVYPIGNTILGYAGINNINHPKYKDDFNSRYIDKSEIKLEVDVHPAIFSYVSDKYVREAQTILNKTGYYVGSVDGIAGKKTILKANEFAKDMGFFSNEEGANPYGISGKLYMKENKFNENLLTLVLMAR